MKIACLQNFSKEGPARIASWAEKRGHEMSRYLISDDPVFSASDYDAFVIMGGPMSANDADENPDVAHALGHVSEFMESGKPVLGVCLGAQMMALTIGGKVAPGPQAEIGWFPIFQTGEEDHLLDHFGAEMTVFHWHGEQIQLPPEARLLASSRVCPVQAFQWGDRCLGLQCHLEVSGNSLDGMLREFAAEVVAGGPTVQSTPQITSGFAAHGKDCEEALEGLLDRWIKS